MRSQVRSVVIAIVWLLSSCTFADMLPWTYGVRNVSRTPAYEDGLPRINSSGQVTWYGYAEGISNAEVWLWDGGSKINLSDSDGMGDWSPDINDGGCVVWNDGDIAESARGDIWLWDGSTKTSIGQTPPYLTADPRISNGPFVAYRGQPSGANYSDIFLWDGSSLTNVSDNIETGEHDPLVNDMGQVTWAAVHPDAVVYDDDIWLWDGATALNISGTVSLDDMGHQMNNHGQVTWLGEAGVSQDFDYDIWLWDGSQKINISNTPGYNEAHPQINDRGQIVWSGHASGFSYGQIWLWDGTEKTNISNNDRANYDPQIDESGVVVWRYGDGNDTEILLWDGHGNVYQITDNDDNDADPQICDNWITWRAHAWPDGPEEIYRAKFPEPGTVALFGTELAAIAALRRRRRS